MESMKFWRILITSLIFLSPQSWAWDSSSAYNTIAMSYTANTTITQIINLNSTQKAATTINFEVDVKNGGGRPTHDLAGNPLQYSTQTDSATITIYRYNSSGTLLGSTVSQTYILKNYGSNAGWSTAPGDNQHPFTQAAVTFTGDLSQTAYIKIEMKGTDGAWWAGNYGAQWRTPTVTIGSSTTNIVYNSEFGIASNGVQAQGWTTSSGSWSNCGVTSGSLTCVTQESGVTANMWGGGEDLNGGTTSGQSGGYSGTLTSDNATQAASGTITPTSSTPAPSSPVPTAIYNQGVSNNVYITNHYPTSNNSPAGEGPENAFDNDPYTKYLNFDKYNAGVTVKLNAGRVVTGFTLTTANDFPGRDPTSYKLYGSNDGVNWTKIQEGNLSLSNSRYTTSSMIDVTNSTAYIFYYIFFPTTKAGEGCGLDCNSMQIAEITYYYDFNNTTTSTATGTGSVSNPSDLCCGGSSAPFNSNTQFTNRVVNFGSRPYQDTVVSITQIGNNNSATVQQSGTKNNYSEIYVQGSYNTTNTTQISTSATATNYIELDVIGSSNTVNLTQNSAGGTKGIYATVNNASNNLTVNQSGNGNHYAEINLSGGNKSVNLTQSGSAAHMANINLSGGSTSLTATQSGNTQQYYSITHNCAQVSCSAITVTQGQ